MLQAYYGIEDQGLWQLATGLGGGIARRGFVCGAVTGGALACGLITAQQRGSTREDRRGLRDESYSKIQQMIWRFEEQFGTVECRTLTGCDLLTPEGQAAFSENQIMERVCRPAVGLVVET
ncbi:MAG: C-GCAxxG-C-C family protein, partial [Chloroflexota bacterium]